MPPTYMGRKTFRWAKMRSGLSKNTMTKKYFKIEKYSSNDETKHESLEI